MKKKIKMMEKCAAAGHFFLTPVAQGLAYAPQHKG